MKDLLYNFTYIDILAVKLFIYLGVFYMSIKIIDCLRWWNGYDDNGNPK